MAIIRRELARSACLTGSNRAIKFEIMTPFKIFFALLSFGLVLVGGCATSSRSNLSSKPWDHPVADNHPGYDAIGQAGDEDDMK